MKTTILACLAALTACASGPRTTADPAPSGWAGLGAREVEVGVVAPVSAHVGVEASAGFRLDGGRDPSPGHLRQAPDGVQAGPGGASLEGGCPGRPDELHALGRMGARWEPLPWLHAGGGVTEAATLYARLGVERRLTPCVAIGIDLLSDRGEQAMLTVRWSR